MHGFLFLLHLQHTATHFKHGSALQTATHCNTLQQTVTHCNALQHTATHCNTLQHTATHGNTLQHTATATHCLAGMCECAASTSLPILRISSSSCRTSRSGAIPHCNTLQHTASHCNILQHGRGATGIYRCASSSSIFTNARPHHPPRSSESAATVAAPLDPAPYHIATHCNTLQHTATHCNTLQHTATWRHG